MTVQTSKSARQSIQSILGCGVIDGILGKRSLALLERLIVAADDSPWPPAPIVSDGVAHVVKASSFADPADVLAFRRAKARGLSDQDAFKVGDNGVGKWGDDCTEGSGPRCALPPEVWKPFGDEVRGKRVLVHANGLSVVCELRDTMPHLENITNGAGIDLNPDAGRALELRPPFMVDATWQWA